MSNDTTSGQETDAPTDDDLAAKRVRFEAFEFRVPAPGRVRVENTSYGDDSDEHVYVVEVAEGVGATACTCPSDEYRPGACKHRRAVENAAPAMAAATNGLSGAYPSADDGTDAAIATDGGSPDGTMADRIDGSDDGGDDTDDDALTCSDCGASFDSFLDCARHERPECPKACDETPRPDADAEPTRSEPADFGGGEGGIDDL